MKDSTARTLIAIDEDLLTDLTNALNECRKELDKGAEREALLRQEVEQHKPMTEEQASAYLGRDLATLQYYRSLGLDSFKKGGSRWYTKGIIDDWLATGRVTQRGQKSRKPI